MTPNDHTVAVASDLLIPLRDGLRVAASLYRPPGTGRWPCLVNYMPYHKDGRGGLWYDGIHRYFAGRGYASLVLDFRGLGCSEGVNNIPFDAQEGRDGHDAVEWAAAQSWCDGNVGMWGSSYGGITSLKTAAQRPPHLKAIVPINATYDNYEDFLLLGGCRNAFWPNGDWGPRMTAYNLTPPLRPDPDGRLAKLWRQRLEHSLPWCLDWYDPVDEAARWAERAIPIEQIAAATFAVCGWKDFYVQGTLDYYQRLSCPRKLLMGPWKHSFPNLAPVEPLNLLELMARWWDYWLRSDADKAEVGPPITLFVQGTGVWRHEETWPPQRNQVRQLLLSPNRCLSEHAAVNQPASEFYRYDPTVGLDSIGFDPWTTAVVDPGDHNGDDARSLCFTTPPLAEDWELTGQARLLLAVREALPGLTYAAKLCDVLEDGRSRLVTMGWAPGLARPTEAVRHVEVPLRSTAHVFRRGHRIHLSLALADFPRLWPTPQPGGIWLEYNPANMPRLLLPHTPAQQPALPLPALPPPGPNVQSSFEQESAQSWRVSRELVGQTAALESRSLSRYQLRDGGSITYRHEYTASVTASDPAGAAIHVRSEVEVDQPAHKVFIQTSSVLTRQSVTIQAVIDANGQRIFSRQWERQGAGGSPALP